MPQIYDSFSPLAASFDGFLLDIWGVLHHGTAPLPGVLACLNALHDAGKKLCLISNSPRRLPSVLEKLDGLGFDVRVFHGVMTSGELTHAALRDRPDEWHRALGKTFYHMGPERDADVYRGLDYQRCDTVGQADFILNTGLREMTDSLADYAAELAGGLNRKIPMLCANPDLLVPFGDGLAICAGEMARVYAERGGSVAYHGKPYAEIYSACLKILDLPKERVLAVGDNLLTDIRGARAAGIQAALVAGGMHRRDLNVELGAVPDAERLAVFLHNKADKPDFVVPGLMG